MEDMGLLIAFKDVGRRLFAVRAVACLVVGVQLALPACVEAASYRTPSLTLEQPQYDDLTCGKDLRDFPAVVFKETLPSIRDGGDPDEDIANLSAQGFMLVGMAQWDSLEYDPSTILPELRRWGPSALVVYHLDGGSNVFLIAPPVVPSITSYSVCSVPQDALTVAFSAVRYDTRRHVVLVWVELRRNALWGIGGENVSPEKLAGSGYRAGFDVRRVIEGLPAAVAGLQVGDVIVEAGGRQAPTLDMLGKFRAMALPERLQLRVWRAGQLLDLTMNPPR